MRKTVCIDFDGVLAEYDGWKGEDVLGDPKQGAKEFVERVLRDYDVVVHTTRNLGKVVNWLIEHEFPPQMTVSREKPPALAYIDDRAVRFEGDFDDAFAQIARPAYWEGEI